MDSNNLRQLVCQPEEGAKLDFKIELYKIYERKPTTQSEIQKWADAKEQQWAELVKDVLALANGNVGTATQTGYLIVGADDKLKPDGTPTLRDVGGTVPTRKEILEKVNSYCQPQVPDLQCEVILVDGVKLLVISIPPTPYLYRLSKQLKTPKKEYSPYTVLIRRGDGERTHEASPDEQRAIEQEKHSILLGLSSEESVKLFEQELDNIGAQVSHPSLQAPYWRINIHPQTYNSKLISSRTECSKLIDTTTVKIPRGGYSYPRKVGNSVTGSNWIGLWTDLFRHEYWRLYQSGQFVNFSGTWPENSNYITDEEIIYTVLTVFEFAANLCKQSIYQEDINVTIELNNVKDLGFKVKSDLNDFPSQYRKATECRYKNSWNIQRSSLSAASSFDTQILEAINWFVECFESNLLITTEIFKLKKQAGGVTTRLKPIVTKDLTNLW